MDLSSYESLLVGSKNGAVLIPGDPEASMIIQKQSEAEPHFEQVLDDELLALTEWIAAGAPEK